MRALVWKNFLWMWRNAPVMAFIIGLPVVQTILFCWSIGHDPTGLKVSIVNEELIFNNESACNFENNCNYSMLSCNYLNYLKKRTLVPVSKFLFCMDIRMICFSITLRKFERFFGWLIQCFSIFLSHKKASNSWVPLRWAPVKQLDIHFIQK